MANINPDPRQLDIEDAIDAEIARQRMREIEADPSCVITGDALKRRLLEWESTTVVKEDNTDGR